MRDSKPIFLGRYNYLSYAPDKYNVVFMPFSGASAAIIARNLSKEDALFLIGEFNEAIDETRGALPELDQDEM